MFEKVLQFLLPAVYGQTAGPIWQGGRRRGRVGTPAGPLVRSGGQYKARMLAAAEEQVLLRSMRRARALAGSAPKRCRGQVCGC